MKTIWGKIDAFALKRWRHTNKQTNLYTYNASGPGIYSIACEFLGEIQEIKSCMICFLRKKKSRIESLCRIKVLHNKTGKKLVLLSNQFTGKKRVEVF